MKLSSKILFLCKRHYMSHDVIVDKYARLFAIPDNLALLGAKVSCLCLNYQISRKVLVTVEGNPAWHSINLFPTMGFSYIAGLTSIVHKERPQVVFASSDVLHIVAGYLVSRCLGVKFIADLYDNYESFGLAKIPFIKALYRKALRNADYIFTVSEALNKHICDIAGHNRVMTIESTIDKANFYRMNSLEARNALGLACAESEILIGLCGALDATRGVEYLYQAFVSMRQDYPELTLVLAGKIDENTPPPDEGVIYLGMLSHRKMNAFFNAMDINVISMIPDDFGLYAFPQKAYEMAASGKPCVVPDFGPMQDLFRNTPDALYRPCDPASIKEAISRQIINRQIPVFAIPSWQEQAGKINQVVARITHQ